MKQNESKPKNTARNVTILIAVLAAVVVAASVAVLLHGRDGGAPTGSASQSQAASGADSSDEAVEGELSYNQLGKILTTIESKAFEYALNGDPVVGCDAIFHIIELRVLFFVNHFFVGESRLGLGVPVDHTYATINQSLVI